MKPLSFIIIGSGWRAMFFVRIAKRFPEHFRLEYMLCRNKEKAERIAREQGIRTAVSAEECEAAKPDFVVAAVSKDAIYQVTREWALKGFAVLCETPAGMNRDELTGLWDLKENHGAKIQVAEQYIRYPVIAAGLKAVSRGKLGEPYGVRLSAAHDYHGASLIRRMLGVEPGEWTMRMRGKRYRFPVTQTDSRYGAVTDGSIKQWDRVCISMEFLSEKFTSGKTAYYDFSGVQYHSFIRSRHLNVQGRDGEWNDTILRYIGDNNLPVKEMVLPYLAPRYRALETEGLRRTASRWNPVLELDVEQDEYAIGTMMFDMREYLEKGTEVYPLADALEDAYTWFLMERAAENPGNEVLSKAMPWHRKINGKR